MANVRFYLLAGIVVCQILLYKNGVTATPENSGSSSLKLNFNVTFGTDGCTAATLPATLIAAIQNEINSKGNLVIDIYKGISTIARNLKNKEDYYENLANKTFNEAILPVNRLVEIIDSVGDRNLTEEALDALILIAKAKKIAFKTERNYGCYAEKLWKLYLEMNTTINKYIRDIPVQIIYNKCSQQTPSCHSYSNLLKCAANELNQFLQYINKIYINATELYDTTVFKDEFYQQRVEDWYKYNATIQINIIIKTFNDWILEILKLNEEAKRRCDEVALTQIKNFYNDQLPRLNNAGNCVANASNQQKKFNYCRELYFCGKLEDALSVFINSYISDINILEVFKSSAENHYQTALESLKSFIRNFIRDSESIVQVVQNQTNFYDSIREKLSDSYSIAKVCNATNVSAKSYCVCAAKFATSQINLLTDVVFNATQQCTIQSSMLSQTKSQVLQFVTGLTADLKQKAQVEADNIIALQTFLR